MIRQIAYRAAKAGIITGLLLAVAPISGETAPLLFTALNNQFFSTILNAPMSSLPAVIFQFALSPYQDWQDFSAWTGALIITLAVLAMSIIGARADRNRGRQHERGRTSNNAAVTSQASDNSSGSGTRSSIRNLNFYLRRRAARSRTSAFRSLRTG